MVILFFHYRRLFITRHKKWDLSLLILQFEAAEKGVKEQIEKFMNNGTHSVDYFHRKIMWDKVGMARNAEGLNQAIVEIAALREEFYKDVKVPD
jgi:succinate dehydrogenase / fumarate reductase flavoprotein subunit